MFRSGRLALFRAQAHGCIPPAALILAAYAVLLLVATGGSVGARIVDVRVLDFNIHRDIGAADSNIGSQPELAKVVNFLNPDVWTINELGGNGGGFNATTAHDLLSSF